MKRILIGILILVVSSSAIAQDPQFSQFYAAPSYLNPAFAGTSTQHRFVANYRNQWPGVPGAFITYNFAYDNNFSSLNSGLGFTVVHDKAGSGGLSFTKLAGQYAYEIKLDHQTFIRPALELGYAWRYIDKSSLTFGDQLVRGPGFSTVDFIQNGRVNYFDMSSGIILYTPILWFGGAVHHMNQPSQSLLGQEAAGNLPLKYSVHGGLKLPIKDFQGYTTTNYITTAFNYKAQGKYDQFDLGIYFERNPMVFGMWYRGIPGFKSYEPGYANNDALILLLGVKTESFKIGYSYDITISRLVNNTGGAHEISLIYEFASAEESLSRSARTVACPKF